MAECFDLTDSISLDCTNLNKGGTVNRITIWNFADKETITEDPTNDETVTDILLSSGKQAYGIETNNGGSVEFTINPSAEGKQTDYSDGVAQSVQIVLPHRSPADIQRVKELINGRFQLIAEAEDRGQSGAKAFLFFGRDSGLNATEITWNLNDASQGNVIITLGTKDLDSRIEDVPYNPFFDTDYATTKAKVLALETPAP